MEVLLDLPVLQVDLAVGVFVYNYVTVEQMLASFREVRRVLRPGGRFVFAVPHPVFAFIRKDRKPPFYFDVRDAGYFSQTSRYCSTNASSWRWG